MPDSPAINEPVPLAFTRALLERARSSGCNIENMLQAAAFPFNPLHRSGEQTFVSMQQYSRLCVELFRELADESGGVLSGSPTPFGTTRLLLLSVIHCHNLLSVLTRAIEFNAACRERQGEVRSNRLEIDADNKLATLHYYSVGDVDNPPPQAGALCGISMWLRLCGWLIDQHIDVVSASCAGPQPSSPLALRHFFPCPVGFETTTNSVTFSARHLDAEVVRSEAELEEFLLVAPYHVVIRPAASDVSITTRIRGLLGSDFREDMPGFDALTGMLNMSARTLRRRWRRRVLPISG